MISEFCMDPAVSGRGLFDIDSLKSTDIKQSTSADNPTHTKC